MTWDRASRARRLGLSVLVGLAGLWLLAVAGRMQASWGDDVAARFTMDISGWIASLCVYVAGGALVTLAFRPPERLRYRPVRAALGAVVPLLLIGQVLAYAAGWALPLAIRGPQTWVSTEILAVLVGVALACGFDVVAPHLVPQLDPDGSARPAAEHRAEPLTPSGRP